MKVGGNTSAARALKCPVGTTGSGAQSKYTSKAALEYKALLAALIKADRYAHESEDDWGIFAEPLEESAALALLKEREPNEAVFNSAVSRKSSVGSSTLEKEFQSMGIDGDKQQKSKAPLEFTAVGVSSFAAAKTFGGSSPATSVDDFDALFNEAGEENKDESIQQDEDPFAVIRKPAEEQKQFKAPIKKTPVETQPPAIDRSRLGLGVLKKTPAATAESHKEIKTETKLPQTSSENIKKFSSSKGISSSDYFNTNSSNNESLDAQRSKLAGSSGLSSDQYFGRAKSKTDEDDDVDPEYAPFEDVYEDAYDDNNVEEEYGYESQHSEASFVSSMF